MNKSLQTYFENTKSIHILLAISLLLIIVVMVIPSGAAASASGAAGTSAAGTSMGSLGTLLRLAQIGIVGLLVYILYRNFSETYKLSKLKNDNIRENTLASYVLCGFMMILLVYIIYRFTI